MVENSGTRAASLNISVLDGRIAVCKLDARAEIPGWATQAVFFSATRAGDELSVVCPEEGVPAGIEREGGWRALELGGPFDLSQVGVLASVAEPLAEAGVSIFAVSTYDTDYVLVKEDDLDRALCALRERGHRVRVT